MEIQKNGEIVFLLKGSLAGETKLPSTESLVLRIRRECRNYLVKTPSDARTDLTTFSAISKVASVQIPSGWRTRGFWRQPIPFRQLKVFKVLPYMEAKSASLQFPPTDLGSALRGHTKQVCIKHRTSTNCVVLTIEEYSIQKGLRSCKSSSLKE